LDAIEANARRWMDFVNDQRQLRANGAAVPSSPTVVPSHALAHVSMQMYRSALSAEHAAHGGDFDESPGRQSGGGRRRTKRRGRNAFEHISAGNRKRAARADVQQ
jgi:hypothetical protein